MAVKKTKQGNAMPNKPYWDETEMVNDGQGAEILALGDSWFWYPVNNLLNPISRWTGGRTILAYGAVGAEARGYLNPYYFDNFSRCLKTYGKIRAVLISGGGNDIAGLDDFPKLLKADCTGIGTPQECFQPGKVKALFDDIIAVYQKLADEVGKRRPEATLFTHQYDHAIPDGRGFLGLGQWLKAPMDLCKVKPSLQQAVVTWLIDAFGERLEKLEAANGGRVVFLRTAGTLDPDDWANELHPWPKGFNKMARLHWVPAINHAFTV